MIGLSGNKETQEERMKMSPDFKFSVYTKSEVT